jgi:hypothetical protein
MKFLETPKAQALNSLTYQINQLGGSQVVDNRKADQLHFGHITRCQTHTLEGITMFYCCDAKTNADTPMDDRKIDLLSKSGNLSRRTSTPCSHPSTSLPKTPGHSSPYSNDLGLPG